MFRLACNWQAPSHSIALNSHLVERICRALTSPSGTTPAAPVCDAGIDWQRNKLLALVRAGTVQFKDINEQPDALAQLGASLDDIRRRCMRSMRPDGSSSVRMSLLRCGG